MVAGADSPQEVVMAESGVPIVCTLHPNEMGGRLEEWHRLFADHLAGIERPAPTRLRLLLAADAGLERTRQLAAREMACCAFMTFTVTPAHGRLTRLAHYRDVRPDRLQGSRDLGNAQASLLMDIEVPEQAAPTLDGLAGIAQRAARTPTR
jgi:hypothetical protein